MRLIRHDIRIHKAQVIYDAQILLLSEYTHTHTHKEVKIAKRESRSAESRQVKSGSKYECPLHITNQKMILALF